MKINIFHRSTWQVSPLEVTQPVQAIWEMWLILIVIRLKIARSYYLLTIKW